MFVFFPFPVCKTCIVRHVETSKKCPICDGVIHKTRPLLNLRVDTKLQEIVYKLVPGLYEDERRRRVKFDRMAGVEAGGGGGGVGDAPRDKRMFFSESDLISLSIEYYEEEEEEEEEEDREKKKKRRREENNSR